MSLRPVPFQPQHHHYPMKKKSVSQSVRCNFDEGGFFKLRVLIGVLLCFAAITVVLLALAGSLRATSDAVGSNQSANGRIHREQDRAVGDGTHCQRTAG